MIAARQATLFPPAEPAPAPDHVAILHRRYLHAVLAGRKRIEARLSLSRTPPFGRVHAGQTIWLKESSGPVRAVAIAARVLSLEALTPDAVARLRDRYDALIRAEPAFWAAKAHARYATFIWLDAVTPIDALPAPPRRPGSRAAWLVMARP